MKELRMADSLNREVRELRKGLGSAARRELPRENRSSKHVADLGVDEMRCPKVGRRTPNSPRRLVRELTSRQELNEN